jgi:hypothetical protein
LVALEPPEVELLVAALPAVELPGVVAEEVAVEEVTAAVVVAVEAQQSLAQETPDQHPLVVTSHSQSIPPWLLRLP